MTRLFTKQLDVAYDDRLIVEGLNLSIPNGKNYSPRGRQRLRQVDHS